MGKLKLKMEKVKTGILLGSAFLAITLGIVYTY